MKLFRRKSKKEKLERKYEQKLSEAHKMSAINRSKSDKLIQEAELLIKQIENEN